MSKSNTISNLSREEKIALIKKRLQAKAEAETKECTLSYGQKALWFLQASDPSSFLYNELLVFKVRSLLDVEAFKKAFQMVVDKHASLRTTYHEKAGSPFQRVHAYKEATIEQINTHAWSEDDRLEKVIGCYETPFELSKETGIRLHLFNSGPNDTIALLVIHHIVGDGWSIKMIFTDLLAFYEDLIQDRKPSVVSPETEYSDFIQYQQKEISAQGDTHLNYWKSTLEDFSGVLTLPEQKQRPKTRTEQGAIHPFSVSPVLHEALQKVAKHYGVSLFNLMLTAFHLLLSKISDQEKVAVGTPCIGRSMQHFESVVGYFVNPLPILGTPGTAETFVDFLHQIKDRVLEALLHQDYPFPLIVEKLGISRDTSRTPIFQTMFFLQPAQQIDAGAKLLIPSYKGEKVTIGSLELENYYFPHKEGRFDLTMELIEKKNGLAGLLKYNTALFEPEFIGSITNGYQAILEQIVENPEQPLKAMALVQKQAELAVIAPDMQKEKAYFESYTTLPETIYHTAQRNKNKTAIVDKDGPCTYAQLLDSSHAIAIKLEQSAIEKQELVAIALPRSARFVASMLGIWEAGGAFLPLDLSLPPKRIEQILTEGGVKKVLTQTESFAMLKQLDRSIEVLDIQAIETWPSNTTPTGFEPTSLAYVIFTSGSSGKPKGVQITHQNLMAYTSGLVGKLNLKECKSFAFVSTFAADLGYTSLFASLALGEELHVLSEDVIREPIGMQAYFQEHSIDCIKITPGHFETMAYAGGHRAIPAFKKIIFGGELLKPSLVSKLRDLGYQGEIFNHYGPTETTIGALTHQVLPDVSEYHQSIPIGRPLPNCACIIVDKNGKPSLPGTIGELLLGGATVSKGYLNLPNLNQSHFINLEGKRYYRTGDLVLLNSKKEIQFIGRKDAQLKIRGFRVELAEIELRLVAMEFVQTCRVLVRKEVGGLEKLLAYVVLENPVDQAEMRAYLADYLPGYMVPDHFVALEQLPYTANGKLDLQKLPSPLEKEVLKVPLLSTLNASILEGVWESVLGKVPEHGGAHFFESGGHSLLAMQMSAKLSAQLEKTISVSTIFQYPSFNALAEQLGEGKGSALIHIPVSQEKKNMPLSFSQEMLWLLTQVYGNSATYNMAVSLGFEGDLQVELLQKCLKVVFERHEVLSYRFRSTDNGVVQDFHPETAVPFEIVDLSKLDTKSQENIIAINNREVASTIYDLTEECLLQFKLIKCSAQRHVLLFSMHHILGDGWSLGILIRELSLLYQNNAAMELKMPLQYGDFARWQRQTITREIKQAQLNYWEKDQQNSEGYLALPLDFPRPEEIAFNGKRFEFELDSEVWMLSKSFSKKEGCTLFHVYFAAFAILLQKLSLQNDFNIGTSVSNRNQLAALHALGMFVNTLPVRFRLLSHQSYKAIVNNLKSQMGMLLHNSDVPFNEIVDHLKITRSSQYNPMFQTLFLYNNDEDKTFDFPGCEVSVLNKANENAKFDLTLVAREQQDSMLFSFEYNIALFEESSIAQFSKHFNSVLKTLLSSPEASIAGVELIQEEEKNAQLSDFMSDLE